MFKRILIILLTLTSSMVFHAQLEDSIQTENLLIVRKFKSEKRAYYSVNSLIVFKYNDSTYYNLIQKIEPDSMLIDSSWIKYSDITSITNTSPWSRHFLKQGSVLFPIAGITFAIITSLNAIINNETPIFYRENLIPAAGLVGLGAIMWPFRTQKYKLKRKWEIIVMMS